MGFQFWPPTPLQSAPSSPPQVTIMLHGRMRCLGTRQRLKSKFGDGYRLQFRLPPARQSELTHYLSGHWPALTVEEESVGVPAFFTRVRHQSGQALKVGCSGFDVIDWRLWLCRFRNDADDTP